MQFLKAFPTVYQSLLPAQSRSSIAFFNEFTAFKFHQSFSTSNRHSKRPLTEKVDAVFKGLSNSVSLAFTSPEAFQPQFNRLFNDLHHLGFTKAFRLAIGIQKCLRPKPVDAVFKWLSNGVSLASTSPESFQLQFNRLFNEFTAFRFHQSFSTSNRHSKKP